MIGHENFSLVLVLNYFSFIEGHGFLSLFGKGVETT